MVLYFVQPLPRFRGVGAIEVVDRVFCVVNNSYL
jgi:hypothetical protein